MRAPGWRHALHSIRKWVLMILVICVGVTIIRPAVVGASEEGPYLSCVRPKGKSPVPRSHPRNCSVEGVALNQHVGELVLMTLRQLSWHDWGAERATAGGVVVNVTDQTRARVRIAVRGRQKCDGRDYYESMVVTGPKGESPHPIRLELGCGSNPEGSN